MIRTERCSSVGAEWLGRETRAKVCVFQFLPNGLEGPIHMLMNAMALSGTHDQRDLI
jgi:hypothetical protein